VLLILDNGFGPNAVYLTRKALIQIKKKPRITWSSQAATKAKEHRGAAEIAEIFLFFSLRAPRLGGEKNPFPLGKDLTVSSTDYTDFLNFHIR